MATDLLSGAQHNVADPLLDRLRLATAGYYDVAGELGRGGMAIVYVGKDLKLVRRVAIKVMDPRLALAPGMADRFLQEARFAAHLQHPNIIVVHDIQQNNDLIYFVMSLIEGGALDELCRTPEPLPIDQIRWILLQAAKALGHAHSEGIIHRDVKPANILINLKGEVILTDFGIAKGLGSSGLTKSGTQIGTPAYMSPEQFSDQPVGAASDQYALGVTAYQLLTGSAPFTGELYQLIAAHGSKIPVPIRELRPDCPPYLANAVMRMLEKQPNNRWPSMDDLEGVFGAGMAMDGGVAKRSLALAAQQIQRHRTESIPALSAKTPISPIPHNSRKSSGAPTELFSVAISPPSAVLFVGATLEMRAYVTSETGEAIVNSVPQWHSSNVNVVAVTIDGRLTGVSAGAAIVRATFQNAWEEASIRVESAPLARITVAQPKVTLRVGDTFRPTVSAVDVNGTTRSDVAYAWISRTSSVVRLESAGVFQAIALGDAAVEVSSGNVRRIIEVAVVRRPAVSLHVSTPKHILELGDACALAVDAVDDLGQPVTRAAVRWTSSEPSIIHVDSAGTALAISAGTAQLSAEIDGVSAAVEMVAVSETEQNGAPVATSEVLTVTAKCVRQIDVSPATLSLEIGAVASVLARFRDARGRGVNSPVVSFTSTEPEVACVEGAGAVRGLTAGLADLAIRVTNPDGSIIDQRVPIRVREVSVANVLPVVAVTLTDAPIASSMPDGVTQRSSVVMPPSVRRSTKLLGGSFGALTLIVACYFALFSRSASHTDTSVSDAVRETAPVGRGASSDGREPSSPAAPVTGGEMSGDLPGSPSAGAPASALAKTPAQTATAEKRLSRDSLAATAKSTVPPARTVVSTDRKSDKVGQALRNASGDSGARMSRAKAGEAATRTAGSAANIQSTSQPVRDTAVPAEKPAMALPSVKVELPGIEDVRAGAQRITDAVRSGSQGNEEIRKLLDGGRPSVTFVPSSATIISEEQGHVRAQFEILLSSYTGGGVPQRRLARITFEATGRRGAAEVRNVQFGGLTKTK